MDRDRLLALRRETLRLSDETLRRWTAVQGRNPAPDAPGLTGPPGVRVRAAVEGGPTELLLYGEVADDLWAWLFAEDEAVILPSRVHAALAETEGDLRVRLNSPGGDVWAGVAVANMLDDIQRADRKVEVVVDGIAASAASIISMRGDPIVGDRQAEIMIHAPMTYIRGGMVNPAAIAEMRKELDRIEANLLRVQSSFVSVYAERNRKGLSEERIAEMVAAETWMTMPEAVEQGFADSVLPPPQRAGADTEDAPDASADDPNERMEASAWAQITRMAADERLRRTQLNAP